MTGPKMILDQIEQAEKFVAQAVSDMQAVAAKLNAQASESQVAMKAPAGGITATNYGEHAGSGRALAETLSQLQKDLATTRQVVLSGSDEATATASKVNTGTGGGAISAGMA
jgi:hypothetical protein